MDGSNTLIQNALKAETPAFVVSEELLRKNLSVLDRVQKEGKCKIILALKGFAMHSLFPVVSQYLPGVTASSLNEALLGKKEFKGEVHTYVTAYKDSEFEEIAKCSTHMTFNSLSQWVRYKPKLKELGLDIECGLRVNPEYSEIKYPIYNPCYKNSRLGVTLAELNDELLDGLSGLHFHTHCASNSDTLERTLKVVEEKFGHLFSRLKWVNFGGGHHITRPDYDVELLIRLTKDFYERTGLDIIIEPGEAVGLHTGFLVVSVLDIVRNEMDIAMLDTSAAAHMPDVLEMPYRPQIVGADEAGKLPYTYRLGGLTCLAGDVIGDYSFSKPLNVGDKLVLLDMAHYSMVKTNTFNGVNLPDIDILRENGEIEVVRRFGYEDYMGRLS